jgi:hypothetical protein
MIPQISKHVNPYIQYISNRYILISNHISPYQTYQFGINISPNNDIKIGQFDIKTNQIWEKESTIVMFYLIMDVFVI